MKYLGIIEGWKIGSFCVSLLYRRDAKKLVDHFAGLEDPRCSGKIEHHLIYILVIAVCAVIAGAKSWVDRLI